LVGDDEKKIDIALKYIKALNSITNIFHINGCVQKNHHHRYDRSILMNSSKNGKTYVDIGVNYFIIWFLIFLSLKIIRLYAEEAISRFK